MLRLGLCCIFRKEPIRFRATTASNLRKLSRPSQLAKLSQLCLHNSQSLLAAVKFVHTSGIGAFRVLSPFFPRYTHPEVGYRLEDLPDRDQIVHNLTQVKEFCDLHEIRRSFHPDQFNVLSSPHAGVVENAQRELAYHGMLAEYIGADVINIHGGGKYDNKTKALQRFKKNFQSLSVFAKSRLAVENDDNIYTVKDLVPLSEELGIPFVYDVHHHRCNPDGLRVEKATALALESWQRVGREPYFHLSSPKNGWHNSSPKPHADYINPADFPDCWKNLDVTVDVEAKAKELAVLALKKALQI